MALLLLEEFPDSSCATCRSTITVTDNDTAQTVVRAVVTVLALAPPITILVIVAARLRSTGALRRALGPVLGAGILAMLVLVLQVVVEAISEDAARPLGFDFLVAFALVPLTFLAGVLRSSSRAPAAATCLSPTASTRRTRCAPPAPGSSRPETTPPAPRAQPARRRAATARRPVPLAPARAVEGRLGSRRGRAGAGSRTRRALGRARRAGTRDPPGRPHRSGSLCRGRGADSALAGAGRVRTPDEPLPSAVEAAA